MENQLTLTSIGVTSGKKWEEFSQYLLQSGRSEKTVEEYVRSLRRYVCYLEMVSDRRGIGAWLGWKSSNQQKRLTGYALRAYAEFHQVSSPNEALEFFVPTKLPAASRPDPRPLDDPEVVVRCLNQTARRILPSDSSLSLRVFLAVLRELGVRRTEAAGIGWNDVDWSQSTVLIHGKGDKNRRLPITKKLWKMLSILRNRSAITPWIGGKGQVLNSKGLADLFKKVAKAAGVGNLKCHTFRTTRLSEIGNMPSFNPILYMAFSGHSDINTARFYVRPAMNRMREMLSATI